MSIPSPAIYSSQFGYGLRVQLFLNGDNTSRGTHLSLHIVPLPSEYAAIVPAPLDFKVVFCLYDLSDAKQHLIKCFQIGSTLYNNQRQPLSINLSDELSKFCPLTNLRSGNSSYINDDTMYIQIVIDFLDLSRDMITYVLNLSPALPNYIRQQCIQDEINRRAQQQQHVE